MKIMITGATGYIGNALARKLVEQGNTIHALVRNPEKCQSLKHENIILFKGDLNNETSINEAMYDCQQVFHVAGDVRIWAKNYEEIFDNNTKGAFNIFNAALKNNVEKVVFTSTCGVLGPSIHTPLTEDDPRLIGFDIEYELSKKMAEDSALKFAEKGLNIVIVRPTKVYGPGEFSSSLSAMQMIHDFLKRKIIFIPSPGNYIGNFCFIDDIVDGHIKAMKYGKSGEKYNLGGENISYHDFFSSFNKFLEIKGRIINIPRFIIKLWAYLQILFYKLFGQAPIFTPKSVDYVFMHHQYSSNKAIKELNYQITPINFAINKTCQFLKFYQNEK
jgi:nucleoside-diphosphate-sugar epimerase